MVEDYTSKLEKALKSSNLKPLNLPSNYAPMISKRDIKSLRNYISTKRYLEKKVFPKIEFEFC